MKKITLFFVLLMSASIYATDIWIGDFESPFFSKWGTNGNIGTAPDEDHERFKIVDNPSKAGINTSDKVGKFRRLKSGNWWALAWFDFSPVEVTASVAQPKYLHISVYKPVASTVCVQVKDKMIAPEINTGELKSDKQTKINEWQDLVFKITVSGTLKMIEVKPDFVNTPPAERLSDDIDIYFDNIVINSDPTPFGEEPEPLPEFKGKLPEGFEHANTLLDPLFYGERFGTFGQDGNATDIVVVDNPAKTGINQTDKVAKFVRKTSGHWWAGVFMTPLNPMVISAANQYFHVMVYRETDPVSLSLKLESSSGNTGDIVLQGNPSGAYDWVDYIFEIPAEKYGTYEKIAFMPDFIESPAPKDRYFEDALIYFDAIEINDNPVPRTSAEIINTITLLSSSSNKTYKLKVWKNEAGNIVLKTPEKDSYKLELLNSIGQLINPKSLSQQEETITVETDEAYGFFVIRLINSKGEVFVSKIIN